MPEPEESEQTSGQPDKKDNRINKDEEDDYAHGRSFVLESACVVWMFSTRLSLQCDTFFDTIRRVTPIYARMIHIPDIPAAISLLVWHRADGTQEGLVQFMHKNDGTTVLCVDGFANFFIQDEEEPDAGTQLHLRASQG